MTEFLPEVDDVLRISVRDNWFRSAVVSVDVLKVHLSHIFSGDSLVTRGADQLLGQAVYYYEDIVKFILIPWLRFVVYGDMLLRSVEDEEWVKRLRSLALGNVCSFALVTDADESLYIS